MKAPAIRGLIVLGTLLGLGALNLAIVGKERIKRDGEIVYLRLAPVDPRSLIQGDYMALRFALAQELGRGLDPEAAPADPTLRDGATRFAGITLDANRVASLAPPDTGAPLRLRYRIRNGQVWLGTNAFFFQEGSDYRFIPTRVQ